MSSPDAARAVAGDSYTPVNFLSPPSPPGAHTHAAQAGGTRWKQLDTTLYIYLKK